MTQRGIRGTRRRTPHTTYIIYPIRHSPHIGESLCIFTLHRASCAKIFFNYASRFFFAPSKQTRPVRKSNVPCMRQKGTSLHQPPLRLFWLPSGPWYAGPVASNWFCSQPCLFPPYLPLTNALHIPPPKPPPTRPGASYSKKSKNELTYATIHVRTPDRLKTRLRSNANRLPGIYKVGGVPSAQVRIRKLNIYFLIF